MIKTFRGLLADGATTKIRLSTNNGLTGYEIKKLQIIHDEPGEQHAEHTVKVFTVKPSAANNTINFDDPTLIAVAYLAENADNAYPVSQVIIMDHVKVNQDLYVTHEDTVGSRACNFYVELEQIKLDRNEATVATLKDMRGRE